MTCGECGNVVAPGAGFPNHVYCKRFLLHMEKREDASRCRDFIPKPQTNADSIRSMADEELAKWYFVKFYPTTPYCRADECPADGRRGCIECLAEWLKQESEGEL